MGTLVFQATLGGAVNIIGPNIASTINFTLPSADGTSGQTWTTNGSGVLAFGTLGIAGGGTGQITATAAFNALAPSQSGQSGKYLTTDGTNTSWGTNPLGTVTSVGGTGTVNGLTLTGTVTTSGNLTLGGTLSLVSPPAIGSTTPNTGAFTTLTASTSISTGTGTTTTAGLKLLNGSAGAASGFGTIYPENVTATAANYAFFAKFDGTYSGINGTTKSELQVNSNVIASATSAGLAVTGTLSSTADATIQGLTVGRGAGAVVSNTVLGVSAGSSNTSGAYNTFVGGQDAALGRAAGQLNTTGSINTALGNGALATNSTGNNNTAVGYRSLSLSTGGENTAFGAYSLYVTSTGVNNVAVGRDALTSNTTGPNNTAVGYQSGYTNQTGDRNTFLGFLAGYSQINNFNTILGARAGYNSTGERNTFVGAISNIPGVANYGCGELMTTGSKNTILGGYNGNQGGLDIRTASNYIVLSDGDGNPRGIFDGSGRFLLGGVTSAYAGNGISISSTQNTIWTNCTDSAQNGLVVQNSANSTGTAANLVAFNVGTAGGGTTVGSITYSGTVTLFNTTSDYRLKTVVGAVTEQGARIDALEPIEYTWNSNGSRSRGFLAHKFQEVYADSVTGEKDAVDANGNPVYQAMQAGTSEVIADLVAEIQSLRKRLADAGIA